VSGNGRKHLATGNPRGGSRRGAGRPTGNKNTLAYGEVKAVKAAGLRVPEGATQEQRELADEALGLLTDILRGKVKRSFREGDKEHLAVPMDLRMRTATHLREEICGPVKQRVEHSFDAFTDEQLEARYRALVAKGTATSTVDLSSGAGTTAQAAEQKGADASLGPNGETEE
jgi:hypothetical protein